MGMQRWAAVVSFLVSDVAIRGRRSACADRGQDLWIRRPPLLRVASDQCGRADPRRGLPGGASPDESLRTYAQLFASASSSGGPTPLTDNTMEDWWIRAGNRTGWRVRTSLTASPTGSGRPTAADLDGISLPLLVLAQSGAHESSPHADQAPSLVPVPLLRCTEEGCGHEFFVRSQLAVGAECEECGAETVVVGVDDDIPEELKEPVVAERAHRAHARIKARQVARDHGFVRPPVIVHTIARQLGFTVKPSDRLGSLRARLVGTLIEVNADEPPVAQRFSVAHELGHHFLGTQHGNGETAEREADAFAGELLVPGPMLREAMRTTTNAVELRALFKVSSEVLEIAARTHALADRLTGT
jgi:hypothetical protein